LKDLGDLHYFPGIEVKRDQDGLIMSHDIIVASSSQEATNALLLELQREFALKDLGDLHCFPGIEVKRDQVGLIMSQGRYATDILSRSGMDKCKAIDTPLSSTQKLSMGTNSVQMTLHSIEVWLGLCNISL